MTGSSRRFVALDRDGTIITLKPHLADARDVELLPGAGAALRRMRSLGLGLIVVTNQSVVGRGIITKEQLGEIHARLEALLADEGVQLDGIYACPHAPEEGCDCRKPRPRLLIRAAEEHRFDLRDCFVVGDNASDMELGKEVGAVTVLVRTGYGREIEAAGEIKPDWAVDDLSAACDAMAQVIGAAEEKAARS